MPMLKRVWDHLHWRLFAPKLEDPTRGWRGEAPAGLPRIRVARFGDCSGRDMTTGHGVHTPPGYPQAAVRNLIERGTGVEFSDVFVLHFHELPANRDQLLEHLRLTGPPDVVLLHIGEVYVWRMFLPHHWRSTNLRDNVSLLLGPARALAYRLLHPLLRIFGRAAAPYDGCEAAVARFVSSVRSEWPHVRICVLGPYPPQCNGIFDPAVTIRINDDLRRLCDARDDMTFIDCQEVLAASALPIHGVNGYNLNSHGSALIGAAVADRIASISSSPAAQSS